MKPAIREGGDDAVHEAEELDTAAALGMCCDDFAGGDFERCEQGRGALQSLDRRLLVDAENNGLAGRINIKPDHIGGFRHERRVVALAPRLAGGKVDTMLAQEASGPVQRA